MPSTTILPGPDQFVRMIVDSNGFRISVPFLRPEHEPSVLSGSNIEISQGGPGPVVYANLQEGFATFKEYLAQCKRNSAQLSNDIGIAKSRLSQIETQLTQLKNAIHQKYKTEKELLNTAIADTNLSMADLEVRLDKKKNSAFSKLFSRKDALDNLQSEIDDLAARLSELQLEKQCSEKPFEIAGCSDDEIRQNLFYTKFTDQKKELDLLLKRHREANDNINAVTSKLENMKAQLVVELDEALQVQYVQVAGAFHDLKNAVKIWDIISSVSNTELKSSGSNTVSREEVNFMLKDYPFIRTAEPAFCLNTATGHDIYIYSAFIMVTTPKDEISLYDIRDVIYHFRPQRFLEDKKTIPADSKIIDNVWFKVNKDGTPDMRFKGNYQTPVVHYGLLNLKINGSAEQLYHVSNLEAAQHFSDEFASYIALLKNDPSTKGHSTITKQYFDTVKEFGNKFVSFYNELKKNKAFLETLFRLRQNTVLDFDNTTELLQFLFLRDLIKCFGMTADVSDLETKEAFALLYTMAAMHNFVVDKYSNINGLYTENIIKAYTNVFRTVQSGINESADPLEFKIAGLLSVFDTDMQKQYLSDLYRFASIVVKADGTVTPQEEAALKKIMSISEQQKIIGYSKSDNCIPEQAKVPKVIVTPAPQSLDEILQELNGLIGLNGVKQEINTLINFIKIQKAREAAGLKSSSLSYHIVFTGNPGTGKTTVARIVAEIYRHIGVITGGQLVETDRSGMIAEYLGQTAIKVNKTVDSALNGVLFIDEAYALVSENRDDFGKEAVATLIKRMEDDRNKLVVILAGYTNEMNTFIDTNPGFKSRFNRFIEFADYSPEELLEIFKSSCKKMDYNLETDAEEKLKQLLTHAFNARNKSFGNGRYVRNIFEKTLEKQSNRIAAIPALTKEILTNIVPADIPET